ncbi:metal/formaldehyde-sensitive transcriptional repressor [Pseudoxanthomonas beigongshangi]
MSHVSHDRSRLQTRVRRLKGQVEALDRAIAESTDCLAVLTQAAAVRGAAQSLMLALLDDHLREHVVTEDDADARQAEGEALAGMLRSYFK